MTCTEHEIALPAAPAGSAIKAAVRRTLRLRSLLVSLIGAPIVLHA